MQQAGWASKLRDNGTGLLKVAMTACLSHCTHFAWQLSPCYLHWVEHRGGMSNNHEPMCAKTNLCTLVCITLQELSDVRSAMAMRPQEDPGGCKHQ